MAPMLHPPQTEVNFTEMPEVYAEGLSLPQSTLRSRRGGGRRTESPDRAWFGEGRKKGGVLGHGSLLKLTVNSARKRKVSASGLATQVVTIERLSSIIAIHILVR